MKERTIQYYVDMIIKMLCDIRSGEETLEGSIGGIHFCLGTIAGLARGLYKEDYDDD